MSALLFAALMLPPPAGAASEDFDYFEANRTLIRNGVQAVLMCNGLFTSGRSLEQVFDQELAYMERVGGTVGTAAGGDYTIDSERRMVGVGSDEARIRAVFRTGVGCVVMAPHQTPDDIGGLPELKMSPPAGDPAAIDWPDGDRTGPPVLDGIDAAALNAASDWAFKRESAEQVTVSLIVLRGEDIVHERYAEGFDRSTRTRTWSTAKSIAVTLIGMLVDQGRLRLDDSLDIDWLPAVDHPASDPRQAITLRHVLNMSSGLYPVDSFDLEYATGSGLAYWAGASSAAGARRRGLIREPGTFWDYENYDTLVAVYAMKQALGDEKTYREFPRRALLDRIGMRNTLVSTDRFGDFIFSSQVYTNARDLARFGLLYLKNGVWNGERLISEEWIEFVRTPAPATLDSGTEYGGQFWLVPDGRSDVPADAYTTAGNRGQFAIIVPSRDAVIVRRGLDYGKQGFNPWDLTREVLKAFPPPAD
ncbi:serine hydrolase domain-containing protein [Elongatibacter sediminis]|uniref:Serine hydrolase n=1 Tax=Elongatibacter sediminis TaxID=3119006 RepID=A0AAW9RB82_9GAMM